MNYLARLKQIENGENFENIPDIAPTKPTKVPFDGFVGTVQGKNKKNISEITAITPEQIQKIQTWLNDIGEEDQHIILNRCRLDPEAFKYFLQLANDHIRDKRHEEVMAMLKAHPDKQRAYLTTETDNGIIVLTVAIRDKATFEMEISREKYDPFLLAEMLDKNMEH